MHRTAHVGLRFTVGNAALRGEPSPWIFKAGAVTAPAFVSTVQGVMVAAVWFAFGVAVAFAALGCSSPPKRPSNGTDALLGDGRRHPAAALLFGGFALVFLYWASDAVVRGATGQASPLWGQSKLEDLGGPFPVFASPAQGIIGAVLFFVLGVMLIYAAVGYLFPTRQSSGEAR